MDAAADETDIDSVFEAYDQIPKVTLAADLSQLTRWLVGKKEAAQRIKIYAATYAFDHDHIFEELFNILTVKRG